MQQTHANALQAERLLEHLNVLCKQIGARPPTSREERRAAEYVRQILETLGIEDVTEQHFASPESLGWFFIPYTAIAAVAPLFGGTLGKLVGGGALLWMAKQFREALFLRQPPYIAPLAQGTSQNVIARIPPAGEVKQRVYVIGHLDSNKQRFMGPLPVRSLTKPMNTLAVIVAALTGASMIVDALAGRKKMNGLQWLAATMGMGALAGLLFDETQPFVEGANDNASAVAVLLGIAETAARQPLQHTEINLLFTGCEEAGDIGIEAFLREYAPPLYNTYWIDHEMVGAGRLCYVTKAGISYVSEYRPAPQITALAAKVAREHPELRVTGKDMLFVDEVSPLVTRGYEAICIAGYDDQGYGANWHRTSDTLENIEGDTLQRAARYTWHLMQAIDERGA